MKVLMRDIREGERHGKAKRKAERPVCNEGGGDADDSFFQSSDFDGVDSGYRGESEGVDDGKEVHRSKAIST